METPLQMFFASTLETEKKKKKETIIKLKVDGILRILVILL